MEPIQIVACTDTNYVMPCGVMFHSICKNNSDEEIIFYVIIDGSVTEENKNSLQKVVSGYMVRKELIFYQINGDKINSLPRLDSSNPKAYISKATYYRLFLTEILPDYIDKVLYLDVDMVVERSLRELWAINLRDKGIAGIPDYSEGGPDRYFRLHYSMAYGYFNAGVLLINLKKWRDENILQQFMEFLECHGDWIKLHDQDVLNRIFHQDKVNLPIKYNLQEGHLLKYPMYDYWRYEAELLEARKNPVIIHYTDNKPWWKKCQNPYKYEFLKYKDETEWCNTPLRVDSFKQRAIEYLKIKLKQNLVKRGILSAERLREFIDTI